MTHFNPDWYRDSHEQGRDLFWYLARARSGDQQAARRALQLIVGSLTPASLQQNGGQLNPELVRILHDLLSPLVEGDESPVLKVAAKGPSHRRIDSDKRVRVWWACVDIHRRLLADPSLSQQAAAGAALAGDEWCEPDSLAKAYRGLKVAVAAYLGSLEGDSD